MIEPTNHKRKIRVVLDMQAAQGTLAADAMRDYTLSLAQSLASNRGDHELVLLLNANLKPCPDQMRSQFHGLLPIDQVICWYPPWPTNPTDDNNQLNYALAERIREAFIADLNPDVLVITGFFSGLSSDYIASIGVLEFKCPVVAVTSHIPDPASEIAHSFICRQLGQLRQASLIMALPPLDRQTLIHRYAMADNQVVDAHDFAAGDPVTNNAQASSLFAQFENLAKAGESDRAIKPLSEARPRMAYVSPLPPAASGIADYSAELLPALAKSYEIDVVVSQQDIADPWIKAHCGVRTVDWFKDNHQAYARVVYHFGNSPFHSHMFDLLPSIPGVVVLHDFFLGDIHLYRELVSGKTQEYTKALFHAHGFGAIHEREQLNEDRVMMGKYPANLAVIQHAKGVIVHSNHARELASYWYGCSLAKKWRLLPLLRTAATNAAGSEKAKRSLGFKADDLLVCSFGMLGPAKLNHRLLEAWLGSAFLSGRGTMWLIFVGENASAAYGEDIQKQINKSGYRRIRITGRVDQAEYRQYLQAADVAVQLRGQSRGETSAAVLDCMNYGLPTIVNANGSLKEIPSETVLRLPDAFETNQLTEALETLIKDPKKRLQLGTAAKQQIKTQHAPEYCARLTAEAVENFYQQVQGLQILKDALPGIPLAFSDDKERAAYSELLAKNFPTTQSVKQLLVDVTITCNDDYKTGIQRVVRALTSALIHSPPDGCRVEPVYLSKQNNQWCYRYARQWTVASLPVSWKELEDEVVEFHHGDHLLIADYTGGYAVEFEREKQFEPIKRAGTSVHFVVYDLLPILMPEVFPEGQFGFEDWVSTVSRVADTALCISQSVAIDLNEWVNNAKPERINPIRIDWFHLGADMDNSLPTRGLPEEVGATLSKLQQTPSFLMVGTIEPRKGYLQAIEAFTLLWEQGVEVNLVIVGKEGWQALPDEMRRTIPAIVNCLRTHPQLGKRLVWLEGISDEYLEKVYQNACCLLAASEGEGFGLPLIEAAQKGLPVLARDIPVFREVAGEHASYFHGDTPAGLGEAIKAWLANAQQHQQAVRQNPMPWLTWREATEQMKAKLLV